MELLIGGNTPQLVLPISKLRTVGVYPAITDFRTRKHASQSIALARYWSTNCHADLSPSNPIYRNQQVHARRLLGNRRNYIPVVGGSENCLHCWYQKCDCRRIPVIYLYASWIRNEVKIPKASSHGFP